MRALLMFFITATALCLWIDDLRAQSNAGSSNNGIYFAIRYEHGDETQDTTSGVYIVSMRPTFTPSAPAMTLASQVTIKVPHGVDTQRFKVVNVQSLVPETRWSARSRVDGPEEDATTDYISLEVAFPTGNFAAIDWQANWSVDLFSFENSGPCIGTVGFIEDGDPFLAPNSASTNPGNQIDILGGPTGNLFRGVYDASMADCSAFDITTPVTISSRSVTATDGRVQLCWQTEAESTIAGFYLYKQSMQSTGVGAVIDELTETIIVAHNSGQASGSTYCHADTLGADESHNAEDVYWLEVVALDGSHTHIRLGSLNDQRIYLPTIRAVF